MDEQQIDSIINNDPIFDAQAESGVITSLLYQPEFILESDFLKPDYFYDVTSGSIYFAIKELFNSGRSIDAFTISQELKTNETLKQTFTDFNMPNIQELKELGEFVARTNVKDYIESAKLVMVNAYKRKLQRELIGIIKDCKKSKKSIDEINNVIYELTEKLSKQFVIEDNIKDFAGQADSLWDAIVAQREIKTAGKITWKWEVLERYAPLMPTEMYIIEGRRKAGKSVMLMDEAVHLLKNDVPVLYIDTEMADQLFLVRLLSNLTGIEAKRINNGNYSDVESNQIKNALAWLKTRQFWHLYRPDFDKVKLYNTCRILKDRFGVSVLIYDYIKSDSPTSEQNYNILGQMTTTLKNDIGGKLGYVVVSAVQLNRNNEVADSDKIERYVSFGAKWMSKTAEQVANDGIECGNACLKISVNRLGEQHDMSDENDYLDFAFNGKFMRIEQAKQHGEDGNMFA